MPKVVVVMSTFNGEKYLARQLDTIFSQTEKDLLLYVRDDGSHDSTLLILSEYSKKNRIIVERGENVGAKYSFMIALKNAPAADYYVFSDQDDVWEERKIEYGLAKIAQYDVKKPILYHSRLNLVDENENFISQSRKYCNRSFLRGETSNVTGCTMIINNILKKMLDYHLPVYFPMHDAWIHEVCRAVDGCVISDDNAYIGYRQHSENVVGNHKGFWSKFQRRLKYYKRRQKCQDSYMYGEILDCYRNFMPPQNVSRCEKLCNYRKSLRNWLSVLSDSDYFRGRKWKLIENKVMILLRIY